MINANRSLLKDDELIIVMGKQQLDRFSGGMQLTVTQIWDLDQARCRFGKFLRVAVNGKAPDVARLVKEFPARREMTEQGELVRGLPVRLAVHRPGLPVNGSFDEDAPNGAGGTGSGVGGGGGEARELGAVAELQLGDVARFFPSDAALAGWRAQADQGKSAIVYE